VQGRGEEVETVLAKIRHNVYRLIITGHPELHHPPTHPRSPKSTPEYMCI